MWWHTDGRLSLSVESLTCSAPNQKTTQQNCRHGVSVKRVNSHNNDDASHAKRSTHGVKSPFGTATTAGVRTCVRQKCSYLLTTGSAANTLWYLLRLCTWTGPVLQHAKRFCCTASGCRIVSSTSGGDFLASFYPLQVTNTMFITLTIVTCTAKCSLHITITAINFNNTPVLTTVCVVWTYF